MFTLTSTYTCFHENKIVIIPALFLKLSLVVMTAVRKKEVKIISFSIKIVFKVFSEKSEFEKKPLFLQNEVTKEQLSNLSE